MSDNIPRESKHVRAAAVELKGSGDRRVRAIVAHTNRVDYTGDVVLPGATPVADVVMTAYNHSSGETLPPGKGRVQEEAGHLVFDAQFFGTQSGREHHQTILELGPLAEWSVEYQPTKLAPMTEEWRAQGARRIIETWKIFAVAPVLVGAMPDTETIAIKCDGCCQSRVPDPWQKAKATIARARATLDATAHLTDPRPDPAQAALARRVLAFGCARWWVGEPRPRLRWFAPDGKRSGMYDEERREIHLDVTLPADQLVITLGHELQHHIEYKAGHLFSEAAAECRGELLLAAWRAREGQDAA